MKINISKFNEKYIERLITVISVIVVGILWICFFTSIWVAIILWSPLPRELSGEPYTFIFYVILFLFFYFLGAILRQIYFWIKQGIPKTNIFLLNFLEKLVESSMFLYISQFATNYIFNAPLNLWRYFYFKFPYEEFKGKFFITPIFSFGQVLFMYVYTGSLSPRLQHYRYLGTIIILYYLPKIVTFSVFLYEILVFKKLDYFYYFAIILIFPMFFSSLRRMLFDMASDEIEIITNEFLTVEIVEDSCGCIRMKYHSKKPGMTEQEFTTEYYNHYDWSHIIKLMESFFKLGERYDYIVNFLLHILLMLGFLFWLLIMLKLY
jgi:hypothetical protein